MAAVSYSIQPLLRLRTVPSCFLRRYASSSSASAKGTFRRAQKPSLAADIPKSSSQEPARIRPRPPQTQTSSLPALNAISSQINELSPQLARKQWYAQKMYEAGRTLVYRPPSHFGMHAAAWAIGGSAIAMASLLAYANIDANLAAQGLPWWVRVTHVFGIVIFSSLGCFLILRSSRIIKSIDLVSLDGMAKMDVRVSRPLPFMAPRPYLISPYEFQMEPKFVQQMEYPRFMLDEVPNTESTSTSFLSNIGRSISQAIYYPFASTKRLLTLEGFMWVSIPGAGSRLKLDTQGLFSNGDKDLRELGTINR